MRALRALLSVFFAVVTIAIATPAWAAAKLDVASVDFREKTDKAAEKRISTAIRRQAHRAAKHLDFGTKGRVEVTFVVHDVQVVEDDGVVTITCTLVGKLKGGGSARSKIRFGGKPANRKKIEGQVVGAAADGVMTRLAQLSRERTAKAKEEKDAADKDAAD